MHECEAYIGNGFYLEFSKAGFRPYYNIEIYDRYMILYSFLSYHVIESKKMDCYA